MNRLFKKILPLLSFLFMLTSCVNLAAGNGVSVVNYISADVEYENADRQERVVQTFSSVRNQGPLDVIFTGGNECSVTLSGDSRYFDKVNTRVSDGELVISLERGKYRNLKMRVLVTCPDIRSLTVQGSGDMECRSDLISDRPLSIRVQGSGDIDVLTVECSELDASVSGSGDLDIDRLNTASADLTVNGSGDLEIGRLETVTANMTVHGSGDLSVEKAVILGGMSAKVQGSGDISVNGQAKEISASVMGSGGISGDMKYEKLTKERAGSGSVRL